MLTTPLLLWLACAAPTPDPAPPAPAEPPVVEPASEPPPPPPPPPPPTLPEISESVAETPEAIAAQLTELEAAIRDDTWGADELRSRGRLQQRIYGTLGRDSELEAQVLPLLSDEVRAIAEANLGATRSIRKTVGRLRVSLPAWTIREPLPADELMGYYQQAEAEFGVHWSYLAAINLVETRMGRLIGVSTADAKGPMQFIPETWSRYGEGDIWNDLDAIRAAARYLDAMGAPEDMDKALWHYNPTDRYVRSVAAYAGVMQEDPLAYRGYYGWEVYYATTRGPILLAPGYQSDAEIPINQWCETNEGCED